MRLKFKYKPLTIKQIREHNRRVCSLESDVMNYAKALESALNEFPVVSIDPADQLSARQRQWMFEALSVRIGGLIIAPPLESVHAK